MEAGAGRSLVGRDQRCLEDSSRTSHGGGSPETRAEVMTKTEVRQEALAAMEVLSKLLYHEPYFSKVCLGHDDAGAHVELHVCKSKLPPDWKRSEGWPRDVRVCVMLCQDEVEKK